MIGGKNIPTDEKLYNSIKKKIKTKFQKTSRWPSAYGSRKLKSMCEKKNSKRDKKSMTYVKHKSKKK